MGKCNLEVDMLFEQQISLKHFLRLTKTKFPSVIVGEAFCVDNMAFENEKVLDSTDFEQFDGEVKNGKHVFVFGRIDEKECGLIVGQENKRCYLNVWLECETAPNQYDVGIDPLDNNVYDRAVNWVCETFSESSILFAAIGCEMFIKDMGETFDMLNYSSGVERWVLPKTNAVGVFPGFLKNEVGEFTVLIKKKPNVGQRFKRYK